MTPVAHDEGGNKPIIKNRLKESDICTRSLP
jgi:hypothetical protein